MDDLGPLLSEHRYVGNGCFGWLMLVLTLGIGVAMLVAMGVAAANGSLGDNPADIAAGLCVAVFFALVGAALIWSSVKDALRNDVFAIHDLGVVHRTRSGETVLRWDQVTALVSKVTELRRTLSSSLIYQYDLFGEGEVHLTMNSAHHSDVGPETGDLLRAKTFEALWPRYKEIVANGGTIKLGSLSIDLEGVRSGKHDLPFEGLRSVVKDGPRLVFSHANGTETRVDILDQPNVHLALALCEHFKR